MATPEHKVKRVVTKALKQYDLYYEMPVPSGYGKSGLDYHGCINGKYFAIETKAPGGKLTPRQKLCVRQITQSGGKVFIIDDVECEALTELKEWLQHEEQRILRKT